MIDGQRPGSREASTRDYFDALKRGVKAVFNVTAMERSILAELSERGGRGQLSQLNDRRPIERLVNKGFVERRTLNSQQEEYVLTTIGKKVLDNK
jgi:DNA-binding MarR family transcriptional regulator